MGWKKMLLGEKMPDKDDPKYHGKYEKDVEAGRRFCRFARIDKAAGKVQDFALQKPKLFLSIVFCVLALLLILNLSRIVQATCTSGSGKSAIEMQHDMIQKVHCMPPFMVKGEKTNSKLQTENDNGHKDAQTD